MKKQIILLNGPSSAGKSTLSKTLQERIEENSGKKFAVISIDDFMKISTEETIYEDDVFDISADMCTAALEALKTSSGVQVTCPLEILLEREYARKNRCLGSAESSFTYLFPKDGYDLTVDTSIMTSEECALRIYDVLKD